MTNAEALQHLHSLSALIKHASGLTIAQSVQVVNSITALEAHLSAPDTSATAPPAKRRARGSDAPNSPQTPAAS